MKSKIFKLKRGSIVTVIGGSGFLGSYVVRELVARGAVVKVVSRNPEKAATLRTCGAVGQIGFIKADAMDEQAMEKAIAGSDAVINLVGILYSRGKQNFENIQVKVPSVIATLCTRHHVKRLIHVSALGIERAAMKSRYAKTKFDGEKAAAQRFSGITILRPSVIFGAEDNFTNKFNWMAKFLPFLPLIGGGNTKFQPIYVADVAKAIIAALDAEPALVCGKTFELGGPSVYSFKEILKLILKAGKRNRLLIPVPFMLAKLKAFFLELAPHPILTRDQINLLKFDNVVFGKNGLDTLNIKPTHMETMLETYIT